MKYTLTQLFDKCNRNVPYINIGDDVSYCFIEDKNTLYIYFEPSNGKKDWKHNFMFKAMPYKDMDTSYKVHRGFLKCWKQVQDIIIAKITELSENGKTYKWKKIITIGYSHGAALATFCHECVWYYRSDLREKGMCSIAFEAPRIYGGFRVKKELKERWDKLVIVRTNNDIVTHMPPFIFGYCHVGHMWKIKGDTNLVEANHLGCVKSHYPEVVLDALKKCNDDMPEDIKDILVNLIKI